MAIKLKRTSKSNVQHNSNISIPSIFMSFYNWNIVAKMSKNYEKKLLLAGSTEDPRIFAAKILFYTLISIALSLVLIIFGIIIFVKFYLLFRLAKYIVLSFMMILFGIIIPPITYLLLSINVSQAIDSRKNGINSETFAFSSVFIIFLRSGLSPRLLFEKLPKTQAFQYINQIMLYTNKRIKYLGESVEEALRNTTRISPSKIFNDFILTYVTAIRTGAPVIETMESKVKDLLKEFELIGSLASDKLQGVAEGYVIWLSSGYIMFFLVLILQAIFPQLAGSIPLPLIGAIAIFLIPAVNLVFILMADQIQLKFPERKMNAYKTFYITFPIGIITMLLILAAEHQLTYLIFLDGSTSNILPVSFAIAIGLIIAAIPPYVISEKELRAGSGYDEYVAGFLRSISEGLRAGLPPETIIYNIKDAKEMGKLKEILNSVYAYIKLGYPLKDAFQKASEKINDFTSKIALVSISDMIDIGSMTPETIESLADEIDSQVRIKREYESKVKVLMFTPYIGVVIALIAAIFLGIALVKLIVSQNFMLVGPLADASILLPRAVFIASISSIFNSFLAGLLVGKIGSGKAATGFKHSVILVVLTILVILILLHVNLSFKPPSSSGLI
ncbi:type II secretion system F family protein [Acidianus brierleyi]|uniref:type II secretion system F family protein n=1 Tax=Acidianus brierleyi TaxID=41673 RepID=UPI001442E929|nr:type II secretion system F family protein [Acidianus brierleyi]QIJ32823.1 flagellar assembly protein [Acidianus brierleyi]